MMCASMGDILARRRAEERFARGHYQSAKTHKARALCVAAQRRARDGAPLAVSLSLQRRGLLIIKQKSAARCVCARVRMFCFPWRCAERAFTKGSHLGLCAPKAPALFSNEWSRRYCRPDHDLASVGWTLGHWPTASLRGGLRPPRRCRQPQQPTEKGCVCVGGGGGMGESVGLT
jgi:hypothetical protein